jgi:ferric-dicitrate binding protein FerR (iron transport regulator)
VEFTLPDGSMIRLASSTVYGIDEAVFQGKDRQRFSGKLILGRIWSKIRQRVVGKRGTYSVETPTAVMGVRGTVFNVDAAADTSTEVMVFDGRVGVEPPLVVAGADKEEIAWPAEVSEKKWEEIILSKLQRIRIGADGRPGKPASFDPETEKDPWVDWNRNRDAQITATATTP